MMVAVLGGAAVAMTVRPSDSSGASSAETPVGVSFPAGFSFLSFFFLLPNCLSRFPCRYPRFFWFLCFGCSSLSLSVGFSLFRFPSPFAAVLSFFLFFLASFFLSFGSLFIRAGGAGSTLPRPIAAHAWGARLLHCCGTGRGGQWRRRLRGTASLSSHHKEVRVASGVGFNRARGERERGRNKRKRTKNFSSPVACPREEEGGTVPSKTALFRFSLFFLMHETASFCLKRAVSFK